MSNNPENEVLVLNVEDVVRITRLGRDVVRELVATGKLPNIGSPRQIRITRRALDRYLALFDGSQV